MTELTLEELLKLKTTNEHDCRRFLSIGGVSDHLAHYWPDRIVKITEEMQGFFGRSDFCLTVEDFAYGEARRVTYIWELKSPRCALFSKERNNRQRMAPSKDLISAENQLVHYVEEAKSNPSFLRFFETRADDVVPGGIIIGRDFCPLGDVKTTPNDIILCDMTRSVHKKYFLEPHKIQLITWSRIARLVERNSDRLLSSAQRSEH